MLTFWDFHAFLFVKIKIYFYFNYFRMLATGRVNKVFYPRIFISKEMIINMKRAFINVPLRHNSAFTIQKWLRFKRVVITLSFYILINTKTPIFLSIQKVSDITVRYNDYIAGRSYFRPNVAITLWQVYNPLFFTLPYVVQYFQNISVSLIPVMAIDILVIIVKQSL